MSRKTHKPQLVIVPLWTRAQAEKAAPYLISMLRSLRESLLEAKQCHLEAQRLASRPGLPNRAARIAHAGALCQARLTLDAFDDGVAELQSLGINCLDPVRGEALLPFVTQQQLAWFIFDLFAEQPLRHWRFHVDPPETRRPLEEIHDHSETRDAPVDDIPSKTLDSGQP